MVLNFHWENEGYLKRLGVLRDALRPHTKKHCLSAIAGHYQQAFRVIGHRWLPI